MSATDELRRMLDERGVEWSYGDGTVSYATDGHWCHAWAYNDDTMCVSMGYFTPEQAIAATLGSNGKSRYTELFGTPERAARTLESIKCGDTFCDECPIAEPCGACDVDVMLEWLRGDAE